MAYFPPKARGIYSLRRLQGKPRPVIIDTLRKIRENMFRLYQMNRHKKSDPNYRLSILLGALMIRRRRLLFRKRVVPGQGVMPKRKLVVYKRSQRASGTLRQQRALFESLVRSGLNLRMNKPAALYNYLTGLGFLPAEEYALPNRGRFDDNDHIPIAKDSKTPESETLINERNEAIKMALADLAPNEKAMVEFAFGFRENKSIIANLLDIQTF